MKYSRFFWFHVENIKKEFENGSRFKVETKNEKTPSGGDVTCYNVEWTPGGIDAYGHQETPFDCFDNYKDVFWYGGAEVFYQQWPLGAVDQHKYKMQTYISHDLIADQGSFGSVMERLFISSSGVALKIHEHDPLWVETIQKHVCLKSQYEESGELELG